MAAIRKKLVIVGDGACGKTCLLIVFRHSRTFIPHAMCLLSLAQFYILYAFSSLIYFMSKMSCSHFYMNSLWRWTRLSDISTAYQEQVLFFDVKVPICNKLAMVYAPPTTDLLMICIPGLKMKNLGEWREVKSRKKNWGEGESIIAVFRFWRNHDPESAWRSISCTSKLILLLTFNCLCNSK